MAVTVDDATEGSLGERSSLIMALLRQETRAAHRAAEQAMTARGLMAPDLSRERYARLLADLHGFYRPLEARLRVWREDLPAACELDRRLGKSAAIEADLRHLGALLPLPAECECASLPGIATRDAAFGTLYVIEGASLGGRIIARTLEATLGLAAAAGALFHHGYGGDTGPMWRRFGEIVLTEARAGRLDQDAVIDQAIATFEAFTAHIGRRR